MNHIEKMTTYVANFVDELCCAGVQHVVISPGSRSTPLAMLFAEHSAVKDWILVDERSAAFFALGLARHSNVPTVLLCTSGSAAANYYPAIVEAYTQRIPLIVLTADRPHELRDIGAPQTMNQIHLYGNFVKWFHDMALPENESSMLDYARSRAARAYYEAVYNGNEGPVHVNFPLREPLTPQLEGIRWNHRGEDAVPHQQFYSGDKQLTDEQIDFIATMINRYAKGLIVCGPQVDEMLGGAICKLSEKLSIPVLADPLSQVRSFQHDKTTVIDSYDALLFEQTMRKQLKPDYIIRFGAMPISKRYLHFITEHDDVLQFVVESDSGVREPTNTSTQFINASSHLFCESMTTHFTNYSVPHNEKSTEWLRGWQHKNNLIREKVKQLSSSVLTEGLIVREALTVIPEDSIIFVSNSMPVRDLDTFFLNNNRNIKVYGNRGVSGIDGVVSSALGVAASDPDRHVTLFIGDLSFYHDLNGLFAIKKYPLNLTVILINNDGGGIFSFLPQSQEEKHFEKLFGTPMGLSFQYATHMYDGTHVKVDTIEQFHKSLKVSYEKKGLHVIEVKTERTANVRWHKQIWTKINEELNKC